MKLKALTSALSVSAQLSEADIQRAAEAGFKAIINNRPDGEACCQPEGRAIAAQAQTHGLAYRHIPVVPGQMGESDVEAFAQALESLDGPVLAFCRTGKRSTVLWALSVAGAMDMTDVMMTALQAGYDLSDLKDRLNTRAATLAARSAD